MKNVKLPGDGPGPRCNRGYLLVGSLVLLIGMGLIGVAMIEMATRSKQKANTLKEKIERFYASDGLMNMLAQEAINGGIEKYLKWDTLNVTSANALQLVASGTANCKNKITVGTGDTSVTFKTNACNGTCDFTFIHRKVGGRFWEVRVHIDTVYTKPSPCFYVNCFLMARKNITGVGAPFFSENTSMPNWDPTEDGWGTRWRVRTTAGGGVSESGRNWPNYPPHWLSLRREDNMFYARFSTDGYSWQYEGEASVVMPDSIFVGVGLERGCGEDTAIVKFSHFSKASTASIPLQVGDMTTYYAISPMPGNLYKLVTDAYSLDKTGEKMYSAPLDMIFEPKGMQVMASQIVKIPVIIYDYRSDCKNPNFQHCTDGTGTTGFSLIKDTLSVEHKPIFGGTDDWGNADFAESYCTALENKCSHRLDEFWCLSGKGGRDTAWAFTRNLADMTFQWKRKSDGAVNLPNYLGRAGEFVSPTFSDTARMANIMWYDSIFLRYDPVTGLYESEDDSLIHTDGKGWGNQGFSGNGTWAMEGHIRFTYNTGEKITFTCVRDDLYCYVNGHAIGPGGASGPCDNGVCGWRSVSVNLDYEAARCHLTPGGTYDLEFFHTRREAGPDSDGNGFHITTSVGFKPTAPRRTWKRNYGNLN